MKSMTAFPVRLSVLFLLSAAHGSDEGLPKFAITSIKVKPVGGGEPENRIKFHRLIRGEEGDTNAYILRDIAKTKETKRRLTLKGVKKFPVFHATKIAEGQLRSAVPRKRMIQKQKVLLCVHGFNVTPESFLKEVAEKSKKFKENLVIPVMWPCEDRGVLGYLRDRKKNAPTAGKALSSLFNCYKDRTKSIMCHSMGNFVLKNFAEEAAESESRRDSKYKIFENIFMVAADLRYDIFKDKINEGEVPHILRLASKKVYVLHSNKDKALRGRATLWYNGFRKALGTDGCNKEKVSKSSKSQIFNRDCNDFNIGTGFTSHSYQFHDEAIRMYERPKLIEML